MRRLLPRKHEGTKSSEKNAKDFAASLSKDKHQNANCDSSKPTPTIWIYDVRLNRRYAIHRVSLFPNDKARVSYANLAAVKKYPLFSH